jgi:hypothetical protein
VHVTGARFDERLFVPEEALGELVGLLGNNQQRLRERLQGNLTRWLNKNGEYKEFFHRFLACSNEVDMALHELPEGRGDRATDMRPGHLQDLSKRFSNLEAKLRSLQESLVTAVEECARDALCPDCLYADSGTAESPDDVAKRELWRAAFEVTAQLHRMNHYMEEIVSRTRQLNNLLASLPDVAVRAAERAQTGEVEAGIHRAKGPYVVMGDPKEFLLSQRASLDTGVKELKRKADDSSREES